MDLSQMSPAQVSVIVLLTGLVIVFSMLIILTIIIKIYGTVVYNAQNKGKKEVKKEEPAPAPVAKPVSVAAPAPAPAVEEGIPQEVVAAITAAVYTTTYGTHTVKSVKRAASPVSSRSAWGTAGLLESTRPF